MMSMCQCHVYHFISFHLVFHRIFDASQVWSCDLADLQGWRANGGGGGADATWLSGTPWKRWQCSSVTVPPQKSCQKQGKSWKATCDLFWTLFSPDAVLYINDNCWRDSQTSCFLRMCFGSNRPGTKFKHPCLHDGQFSQLEFLGASVLKDSVYLIDLGSLARCAGIYSCQFLPIFWGEPNSTWWYVSVELKQKEWLHLAVSTSTWNPKQPIMDGCFTWMIPSLYKGNESPSNFHYRKSEQVFV